MLKIVSCLEMTDDDDLSTTLHLLPIHMHFHKDIIAEVSFQTDMFLNS